MKKFLLVLLIVLGALALLAACAPVQQSVENYVYILPDWAIIVGAVVLFVIGFGLIWKLIPGFIKVIAIIALAVILAGTAYGLWESPFAQRLNSEADHIRDLLTGGTEDTQPED